MKSQSANPGTEAALRRLIDGIISGKPNYDEMSAALGVAQLRRLDEILTKREMVAARYCKLLEAIPGVTLKNIVPSTTRMSWFVFMIHLDPNIRQFWRTERPLPNPPRKGE